MHKYKSTNFSYLTAIIFLISSCGGGGGGGGGDEPYTPSLPNPTSSISANPTTIYVNEVLTISWSSTNATSCSASGAWDGEKSTSGEEELIVTEGGEFTYIITCSSSSNSATANVIVIVNPINTTGKYKASNESNVYIEAEKKNLFNTPVSWQYSLREHSGYTYGNSASGEPIIF